MGKVKNQMGAWLKMAKNSVKSRFFERIWFIYKNRAGPLPLYNSITQELKFFRLR